VRPRRRAPSSVQRCLAAEFCRQLAIRDPHASPQPQHLLSEFRLREVRHIQADHDGRRRSQPPPRRARDAKVRRDGHVAGALHEIPEAVVVTLLRAPPARHGPDHRPFPHAAQLLTEDAGGSADVRRRDDNSRQEVQNVRTDSSADNHHPLPAR
jgi:hypothetical protein